MRWLVVALLLALGGVAAGQGQGQPAAGASASPSPSPSDPIQAALDHGLALFGDLEYGKCIAALEPLIDDPAASQAQRLTALELVATSHLILGHKAAARREFEALLAIDPGYQLQHDDGSPKIVEFFAELKARRGTGGDEVTLRHSAPPGATAGHPVELEAVVAAGAEKVRQLVLFWRRRGAQAYAEIAMRSDGAARYRGSFTAPASPRPYVVDYYLEARNVAGGALGRAGGPEMPLALAIAPGVTEEGGRRPWYRHWYVVAGGAAVVGFAATALILSSRGSTPDGSLGRVTLSP